MIAIALLQAAVRELIIHDADESRVATLLALCCRSWQSLTSSA